MKTVWSDADFELMGWHDCALHAIAFEPNDTPPDELLFDIDYIMAWLGRRAHGESFSWSIAPATLVFAEAFDVGGSVSLPHRDLALSIADIDRRPVDDEQAREAGYTRWRVACHGYHEAPGFDLAFTARGFVQYLRAAPIPVTSQRLASAEVRSSRRLQREARRTGIQSLMQ